MSASTDFARRVTALRTRKSNELSNELKQFGCPFDWADPRAEAWCAGYKAGLDFVQAAVRQ